MIIEKQPLPNDPTPTEAPPSYEAHLPLPCTEKSLSIESPFTYPPPPSPGSSTRPAIPNSSSSKGKGRSTWFNFAASRTSREVRITVLGLVRDLVSLQQTSSSASRAILESCVEACSAYDISFSSLLQEKSIESHTPLYWAIVKRPPEDETADNQQDQGPDLLTVMLSFASPLSPATLSEIRHACLLTSDQALFQRLRQSPEFSPVSGTDAMLLGAVAVPDEITVENVPGDEGAFAVNFEIAHFQKRMRISKRIELEFIARARMWRLAFFVASERSTTPRSGSWCVSLVLMEHSPPTWIDSRVLIPEHIPLPNTTPTPPSLIDSDLTASSTPPPQPRGNFFTKIASGFEHKPKPPISLRLKTGHGPLVAAGARNGHYDPTEIVVSLDDSPLGGSLQFAGSSYIAPNETLRARLEARLAKPETDGECVVC